MKRSSIESSLKRFLKRKVKITLGMVVAFLITGAVGYGADDIAAQGQKKSYKEDDISGNPKIIGGWNYITDPTKNEDHSTDETSITLESGTIDELIGGNHLKKVDYKGGAYLYSIGNTSVIMNDGKVQYLIGGSKSNGTKADITNGKTKVIVNGGTIGEASANIALIGGNYIKSTSGQGTLITAKTDGTDVEITGGTFKNKVIGGSFAETYGTPVSGLSVEDKETNLKISGGTFDSLVIGGGAAAGTGNTSTVGTSNLEITGGTFNANIYAGGAALETVTGNGGLGTANVTNSNLTIGGSSGNPKLNGAIYAGGLDSGVSNVIKLIINKVTNISPTGANKSSKIGIYGGSKAGSANTHLVDGDTIVEVLDSDLYADISAGGGSFGAGSTLKAGDSKITVSNTSVSGYEDNKNNTWTGRIFGAGKIEGGASLEQKSTNVVINNVTGKTYNIDAEGEIGNTIGARVYGGGQNYKKAVDSQLKVESTKVTINGKDTALAEVYGGSIISGTGNKGTAVTGKTDVTINDGKIVDYVVGGNNTNWNGYSVVGIEDKNGNHKYVNNKKYNDGSTKITINGGDMSTAEIIGGSLTDYGWYYESEDNVIHDAVVYGTTNIDVNGGKLGLVVGGGKALYYNVDALKDSVKVYPTTSNVIGTTNVNITNGELLENIIGGGYAFSNQDSVKSIANVTGTTNINISGGTIEKNIYGGGFADGKSATANVEGDTNITISGGDIKGNIYAGGLTANDGTADVTGNAVVTFLNGSTFANHVSGLIKNIVTYGISDDTKIESKSTLAFGNDKEKFEGEFKGTFSDFDILRTGKGSVVGIGELNKDNINRDIEITGSGRIETKINNVGGDIALSGGTLATDTINLGGKKLTLSSKGILETKSVNIFTNALDAAGTTVKASGDVKTGESIKYDGGSVALNDSKYNLDYLTSAIEAMKTESESKTSILMLGTLVNIDGTVKDELTFEEAAGMGDSALLDNVTVKIDEGKSSLVIGDKSEGEIEDTASTNSNLNASTLNFESKEDGEKSIAIKEDSKLVLGGSGDGELVTVNGAAAAEKVSINVEAGTLVLGSALSSGANQTLSAGVKIGSGTLEVNAGNQNVTGTITSDTTGTVAVNKDAVLTAKEVLNKGTLSVAGNAEIKTLTGGENSTITVGDSSSAGKLVVETLKLDGGKMFLDPAWVEGENNPIENASKGAVIFDKDEIDGQIAVGQNSVLVVGDKDTDWAEKAFENSGLKWKDDITAALAIRGNQTLGTLRTVAINDGSGTNAGSINVDGNLTGHNDNNYKEAGNLNFADKSLLIVDVGSLDGGAAISGVTKLSVADTSKLYLENATAGTHTIVLGTEAGTNIAENSSSGWSDENISSSDRMLKLKGIGTNNGYKVEATAQKAQDVLLGVVVPNMINNIWGAGDNDIDSSNEGIKFLSRAMSTTYTTDTAEAVRTINSAVQISAAGVVNRTAIDTVRRTSDTAINNLSLKNESNVKEGLWAEMSYGSTDVSGVKIGNTDTEYNGRYEGISVGSNFKTWENGALGGAFHYVLGENKSDEGVNRTKNEYEYFGLSLYSNWRKGNFNIIGDLGYSMGDNEIKQDTSIVGRIKADVDTEVATAGVRGEYLIQKDNFNIMPYAGLRYVRLNVDSFDTKNGNGKMFHTEKEDADLFLVPVGVNISTQAVNQNGWTVKPKLDLAYIGALGDKKSETKVGVAGYSAIDEIKVNMADSSAFSGSLGVEFKKDNKTFEVGYSLYSSKHETENRGTLSFKYNF
ncbi:autotransporter domain-containing protein [uncultured Fusobacterium sp.]|uniref:autotransporter domain-containing protein n=1 Tax=uncultured Fusobacterium sp. TaxID=159267 RepID=UPI0025FCE8B3|nr:autotransporter domain-containing protein [uncultured Fusobacterium sp.]